MTSFAIRQRWPGVSMLLPLVGAADATLTPQPLAKLGPCPSGDTASGHDSNPGPKTRWRP